MKKKSSSAKEQKIDNMIDSPNEIQENYIEENEMLDIVENEYEDDLADIFPSNEETTEENMESIETLEPAEKPSVDTKLTDKQKIKAIKRAIENKEFALDREQRKVTDWRKQAKIRDEKAMAEYNKRKTELEELLRKCEERHTKRMLKTQKWWHDYSDNYEATKIKKISDDIALLQTELQKLETLPEEETK